MSTLIAVYSTRSGQGSTYWATCLAWTLAEQQNVLLIDADMEGGTIADVLYLQTEERSLANCFSERATRPDELLAQSLTVPGRPQLSVVPGLRNSYGYDMSECLTRLGTVLTAGNLPHDIVIADLGHPLAYPTLRNPHKEAEKICQTFSRAFVVIRDDPSLLARSIHVLRGARPPHGEFIITRERSGALFKDIVTTMGREIPDLPVRDSWAWENKRAQQMADSGKPMLLPGIARVLGL